MRIFVTGATGFIGKSLIPLLLSNGHELLILTRGGAGQTNKNLTAVVGNLNQPATFRDALRSFAPNCSIHLAWQGLPDYSFENCRNNLLAGLNLFEMLRQTGCNKVVAIGTCWEYGGLSGTVHEGNVGSSLNLFASFKLALRHVGASLLNSSDSNFVWARPFFVYGPDQRQKALMPTAFRSLRLNEIPSIQNLEAANDFVHVDDVAAAIAILAEVNGARGDYNIGSGELHAVWEVVNQIAHRLKLPEVYELREKSFQSAFWASTQRIKALGWKPRFDFQQGISQTVDKWLRQST
jgi:nucleoside-diphosphate-sugar epimerase